MVDLIARLERSHTETLERYELAGSDLERRYGPATWTIRQILHHLSDAESVLFDRIRRIISEPRQVIWAFDQDAWAAGLEYESRPLALSRALFSANRAGVIHYARGHYLDGETLDFVHSETGVRTLRQEFDKVADHNEHHLQQIRRALGR